MARSSRQRDLTGPIEPADRLASSPVGHASVDEARLDVSMTEVILYEVDRLAALAWSSQQVNYATPRRGENGREAE